MSGGTPRRQCRAALTCAAAELCQQPAAQQSANSLHAARTTVRPTYCCQSSKRPPHQAAPGLHEAMHPGAQYKVLHDEVDAVQAKQTNGLEGAAAAWRAGHKAHTLLGLVLAAASARHAGSEQALGTCTSQVRTQVTHGSMYLSTCTCKMCWRSACLPWQFPSQRSRCLCRGLRLRWSWQKRRPL